MYEYEWERNVFIVWKIRVKAENASKEKSHTDVHSEGQGTQWPDSRRLPDWTLNEVSVQPDRQKSDCAWVSLGAYLWACARTRDAGPPTAEDATSLPSTHTHVHTTTTMHMVPQGEYNSLDTTAQTKHEHSHTRRKNFYIQTQIYSVYSYNHKKINTEPRTASRNQ